MTDISYCKGVCVDLLKEVERLLAERDEWKQAAGAEADERRRAHDEIERLREALQTVRRYLDSPATYDAYLDEIIEQALKEKE